MTRISSTIILLLSLSLTLAFKSSPLIEGQDSFPSFKIDLDLDPKERFKESAEFFKEPIIKVFTAYMEIIPEFVIEVFAALSPLI